MSQYPDTKGYILVFSEKYLEKLSYPGVNDYYHENFGEEYEDDIYYDYYQIDNLKSSFAITNWTSGNEQIDNIIQRVDNRLQDVKFEWVSYDQFTDIEETLIRGFVTAMWKDGPLKFSKYQLIYTRNPNSKVALKIFYNSQTISNEFLNK
jgi:hypothetical protein